MNKWKTGFWVLLFLFIISNCYQLYCNIDQGISYTYLSVSNERQEKALEVLGNLIVRGSGEYTQKDILHLMRLTYPESLIDEEGDSIYIEQLNFKFKNNRLDSVRFE